MDTITVKTIDEIAKRGNTHVFIPNIADVKTFVNTMMGYKYSASLIKDGYIVDAKSIMGVFSLDVSKPVELRFDTDNVALIDNVNMLKQIQCYISE